MIRVSWEGKRKGNMELNENHRGNHGIDTEMLAEKTDEAVISIQFITVVVDRQEKRRK